MDGALHLLLNLELDGRAGFLARSMIKNSSRILPTPYTLKPTP